MEWRTIDSAPKRIPPPGANISLGNPEIIVGWVGSRRVTFAYWEPERDETDSWDQSGRGRWCVIGGTLAAPTHWVPLPEPPQ